jgi:hypothetical protein
MKNLFAAIFASDSCARFTYASKRRVWFIFEFCPKMNHIPSSFASEASKKNSNARTADLFVKIFKIHEYDNN